MSIRDVFEYQLHKLQFNKRPLSLVMAFTDRCILRCEMCNIWKNKSLDLNLSQWEEILCDDFYKKVKTIVVTGGEPMMYSNFIGLCELVIGILPIRNFIINTSGLYTKKFESLLSVLSGRKINTTVIISLDGGKETHNRIRGIHAAFNNAMDSARIIKDFGFVKLSFQMTISNQSIRDIEDVRHIAETYNAHANFKIAYNQATLRNESMTFGVSEEVRKYLVKMYRSSSIKSNWRDKTGFQDMTNIDELYGKHRAAPCSFFDGTAVYLSGTGKKYVCQSENIEAHGLLTDRRKVLKKETCLTCWNTCLNTAALRGHWIKYASYLLKRKFFAKHA